MCCCVQVAALERQALLKQQEAQAAAGALARHERMRASQRLKARAGVLADPVLAVQRVRNALEAAKSERTLRCDSRCFQMTALSSHE